MDGASLSYDLFFSVTDGQNANTELIILFLVSIDGIVFIVFEK